MICDWCSSECQGPPMSLVRDGKEWTVCEVCWSESFRAPTFKSGDYLNHMVRMYKCPVCGSCIPESSADTHWQCHQEDE